MTGWNTIKPSKPKQILKADGKGDYEWQNPPSFVGGNARALIILVLIFACAAVVRAIIGAL